MNQKYFHFYSVWSIIIHIMYFLRLIKNTYPIALFVLTVSQFFLFIYPSYITIMKINWIYEFILHWLPIILIKPDYTNMNYLYASLLAYVIIFNTKIFTIYSNPIKYLS
jgi:hypothetical protein